MSERATSADDGVLMIEHFRPYRQLAVRVLAMALRDAADPGGSPADRESARTFVRGSNMLLHWCRVAALDPGCVIGWADKLGAGDSWLSMRRMRQKLPIAVVPDQQGRARPLRRRAGLRRVCGEQVGDQRNR